MRIPLSERLTLRADDFRVRLPDYSRAMDALAGRLRRAGAGQTAPDIGGRFPDFILPDAGGRLWRLAQALDRGPLVLAFHRGYWCDFCQLNMEAIAEISPAIESLGCQIVAISPEDAGNAARLAGEAGATFPILCDIGLGVSSMLGLSYVVDADLQHQLSLLDVDLDAGNCGEGWVLPISATFVLDGAGIVVARHLDPDPRSRMDGDAILQAVTVCQRAARS